MNAMVWTLWLITSGTIIGQGASHPSSVTPIASYSSHDDCISSLQQIYFDTKTVYGAKNTPQFPGFFFCVATTPKK